MERWLITGAGRGIGYEFTRALLARGDEVVATVRSDDAVQRLMADLGAGAGGRLNVIKFDVSDLGGAAAAAQSVTGAIDVLVCNAGILGPSSPSPLDVDCKAFIETLTTNAVGPLLTAQAFVRNLREAKRPRIIMLTSRMGSSTYEKPSDLVPYQASKAAANKVARGLAEALKGDGIAVLAMHPGFVATELSSQRSHAVPITPEESVGGMLKLVDGVTIEESGTFMDYRGRPYSW